MWAIILFACLLPSLQYVVLEETYIEDNSQPYSSSTSHEETVDPVTTPAETCSPDKSLFTKKDIRIMMDYLADLLNINQSINNSYYAQATVVHNKHIEDLKNFLTWFQDRPEHLKHVLEDFTFLKNHIEENVRKVANALEEYSQLEENYQKQSKRTNELSKNINRYKVICQNNCLIQKFLRANNDGNDNYYCSSLEDLQRNIGSKLTVFTQQFISAIQNQITYDDQLYAKDIDELKNNLKDVALKEFGRTMYDILTLSDEYHHFIKKIFGSNVQSEIYNIKDISLQIDSELLELERRVEKYGEYCRNCNNAPRSVSQTKIKTINIDTTDAKTQNIVDELLNIKYTEIETAIHNDYMTIFQDLNSLLNNTDFKAIYSTDLKPIQDEVLETLKKSRSELDELKSIVPQWSVNNLFNLLSESAQLLLDIKGQNSNLNKFAH